MKIQFVLLSVLLLLTACSTHNNFEQKVKQAIEVQLKQYPKSTLQDLYKNFFQDKFGPRHMITDTTAAQNYLTRELASFNTSANPEVEPTGWEHNFFRVNLVVLKNGKVPYHLFFNSFIESVNVVKQPELDDWIKEWNKIELIIKSLNLNLPYYNEDKVKIDSLLKEGKFAMHHSKVFGQTYQPHYRIISRMVFERDLQKYFTTKQTH